MTPQQERAKITPKLRFTIMRRDNFACVACGKAKSDGAILHVDHIVPVSCGGKTELANLQTLCAACNLGKGTAADRLLNSDKANTATAAIPLSVNQSVKQLQSEGQFPIGFFFHIIDAQTGEIDRQGIVVGKSGAMFLVRYFNWLDGCLSERLFLFSLDDMKDWHWYQTAKHMRMAYAKAKGYSEQDYEVSEYFATGLWENGKEYR